MPSRAPPPAASLALEGRAVLAGALAWRRRPWPPPARGRLDLVCLELDLCAPARAAAARLLSDAERDHAASFAAARDRARWVAGRAELRRRLGRALGCPPGEVPLSRPGSGKPRLEDGACALSFNLSHAGGRVLIALAQGVALGVDLEHPGAHPRLAWRRLAARGFAPAEAEAVAARVAAGDAAAGRALFFDHWLVKEAVLKAAGAGLGAPLAAVPSAAVVRASAATLACAGGTWHCRLFDAPGGGRAALAVAAPRGA